MIKKIGLALTSTWVTLLGADAFLAHTRVVPDTRGKLEVVTQLREEGVDAYPQVYGSLFVQDGILKINDKKIFPLSGVANKTVVYCNESGQWLIYDSDEYGFHNPRGLWGGNADIVIIGDSFANGACVPSDKNTTALIRRKYKRTLTLGAGASSAVYQLGVIKEYLGALKPKVVLWFFDEMNDLEDLLWEKKSPALMRYLEPEFRMDLIHQQPAINEALLRYIEKAVAKYGVPWNQMTPDARAACTICGSSYYEGGRFTPIIAIKKSPHRQWIRDRLGLVEIQRLIRNRFRTNGTTVPSARAAAVASQANLYAVCKSEKENLRANSLPVLQRAWKAGSDYIRGWGGTLYIVYLPSEPSFRDPRILAEDLRLHDEIVALARAMNFKLIDATADFKAHPAPLLLWQGHYNEAGYEVVSNAILRALKDEQALR